MGSLPDGVRDDLIVAALHDVGVPYRWGGNGPKNQRHGVNHAWQFWKGVPADEQWGIDCSGAVLHWYREAGGVIKDYTAAEMFARFPKTKDPQRGDLAFYGREHQGATHVAMLLTDGGSVIIGANSGKRPNEGETFTQYRTRMKDRNARVRVEDDRRGGANYRGDLLGYRTWPWNEQRT